MTKKKSEIDEGTVALMRRLLAMPPKAHDEMKVGRKPTKKKKRGTKGRASSAKRRTAK